MKSLYKIIFFCGLLFLSCTNENEDDFFLQDDCNLDNVTYNTVIQDIIESKCMACHAEGNINGPVLDSYENVVMAIDDVILNIIDLVMPPLDAVLLTECEIEQIQNWFDNEMDL